MGIEPTIQQQADLLRRRFCHQTDQFAHQWYSAQREQGGYIPVRVGTCRQTPPCEKPKTCRHRETRPLRDSDLIQHLKGEETLGIYQLADDDTVRWIALDVDINSELVRQAGIDRDEALANVRKHTRNLARVAQGWNLPFLVEHSGNKGYHVWLFMAEPVPAAKAMAVGRWIEAQVTPPSGIAVEVFPKQTGRGGFGSLVKLPLGVHRKTRKRTHFVGPDFEPLDDQWTALRRVLLLTEDEIDELIEEHGLELLDSVRFEGDSIDYEPRATLPCFINLMNTGVARGMRDVAAFKLGCYLRSRGLPVAMATAAMETWNDGNDPPMDRSVLHEKIESSFRGSYSPFPCSEPMFDHLCDPECRFYASKMAKRQRRNG